MSATGARSWGATAEEVLVVHPGGMLERALRAGALPWLDLVMARKQLHTLRDLAEASPTPSLRS